MAAQISNIALKCKSQLETSLFLYRIGSAATTPPLTDDPHFEEKFLLNVSTMRKRQSNAILIEYYRLGAHLYRTGARFQSGNAHNRIATFLYKYYRGEPDAIKFLENVTTTYIERFNDQERTLILDAKPQNPLATQGPSGNGADDMWQELFQIEDYEEIPTLFTRPSKRRRSSSNSTVTTEPYHRSVTPTPAPDRSVNPLGITLTESDGHFIPNRLVEESIFITVHK